MIATARLKLVPSTAELVEAEIHDHAQLARLLSALVPDNWPPESTADALEFFLDCVTSSPDQVGWFSWYAITGDTDSSEPAELVGGGGFMGPPNDGAAQIGYSVIDQHQQKGYATEIVQALTHWALSQPGCKRVVAETEWANPSSVRVLEKNGFIAIGSASNPEGTRFELTALMEPLG